MTTRELIINIRRRMREIDPQDHAPLGDDYNLLWDAILDEMSAALDYEPMSMDWPTFDIGAGLG